MVGLFTPCGTSEILVSISTAQSDKNYRNLVEQELQKLQYKYASLVENNPLAVIEWNIAFEVIEWNPAAEEIFGYSKQEALGQHLLELVISD